MAWKVANYFKSAIQSHKGRRVLVIDSELLKLPVQLDGALEPFLCFFEAACHAGIACWV